MCVASPSVSVPSAPGPVSVHVLPGESQGQGTEPGLGPEAAQPPGLPAHNDAGSAAPGEAVLACLQWCPSCCFFCLFIYVFVLFIFLA